MQILNENNLHLKCPNKKLNTKQKVFLINYFTYRSVYKISNRKRALF